MTTTVARNIEQRFGIPPSEGVRDAPERPGDRGARADPRAAHPSPLPGRAGRRGAGGDAARLRALRELEVRPAAGLHRAGPERGKPGGDRELAGRQCPGLAKRLSSSYSAETTWRLRRAAALRGKPFPNDNVDMFMNAAVDAAARDADLHPRGGGGGARLLPDQRGPDPHRPAHRAARSPGGGVPHRRALRRMAGARRLRQHAPAPRPRGPRGRLRRDRRRGEDRRVRPSARRAVPEPGRAATRGGSASGPRTSTAGRRTRRASTRGRPGRGSATTSAARASPSSEPPGTRRMRGASGCGGRARLNVRGDTLTAAPRVWRGSHGAGRPGNGRPDPAKRPDREHPNRRENTMDLGIAGRRAIVCAASKGLGRGCARALAEEGVEVWITARTASTLEETAAAIRFRHRGPGHRRARRHHDPGGSRGGARGLPRPRHPRQQRGRTASRRLPGVDPRRLERGAQREHADRHRAHPGDGGRDDGARVRPGGEHHVGGGQVPHRHPRPLERRPGRPYRLRRRRREKDGAPQRHHQRPAPRAVRHRPAEQHLRRALERDRPSAEELKAEGAAGQPGRPGSATAEEFGHACAFLCSAHAGFITGQNLLMDGGSFPGTL